MHPAQDRSARLALLVVAALALAFTSGIAVVPWLEMRGAPAGPLLRFAYAPLCHQLPERSFELVHGVKEGQKLRLRRSDASHRRIRPGPELRVSSLQVSGDHLVFGGEVAIEGHFGDARLRQVRALEALDSETERERRPTVLFDLVGTTLSFEGKDITFPKEAAEELGFAARTVEPFTAADLPGELDEEGRLVLVRRLVREGLLLISEAARGSGADAEA